MDKITLTKAAFLRWINNRKEVGTWETLVTESQRPELIELWAVVHIQSGNCMHYSDVKEFAERWIGDTGGYRIVHLKEVVGV